MLVKFRTFLPTLLLGFIALPITAQDSTQNNQELLQLFKEDQADRSTNGNITKLEWDKISQHDVIHRQRVQEMLTHGQLQSATDYYYAAMIFQHGQDSGCFKMANILAQKVLEKDSTYTAAKWLFAASKDRYLRSIGKKQWYGTQYEVGLDGRLTLNMNTIDTAITDHDRIKLGIPTLSKALQRVEQINQQINAGNQEDEKNILKEMNSELYPYYQDYKNYNNLPSLPDTDPLEWKSENLSNKEIEPLNKLKTIIEQNGLKFSNDYFIAAFLLHRSAGMNDSNNFKLAHSFALEALKLGVHKTFLLNAKILVARSQDRYLRSIHKPQWYGTQYKKNEKDEWILSEIDTKMITDNDRKELALPPLNEIIQSIKRWSKN